MITAYPPELCAGQAAGRPEWQKRLTSHERQLIDRLANEAYRSEDGLRNYINATEPYRTIYALYGERVK